MYHSELPFKIVSIICPFIQCDLTCFKSNILYITINVDIFAIMKI